MDIQEWAEDLINEVCSGLKNADEKYIDEETKEKINFRQVRDFGETFNVSVKFFRQNFKLFFQSLIFTTKIPLIWIIME